MGQKLAVIEQERTQLLDLSTRCTWLIGRSDPLHQEKIPDIPFYSPIVSRTHGWFHKGLHSWYYIDNPQNTNGTFVNGQKLRRTGRIRPVELKCHDILMIDSADCSHGIRSGVRMVFLPDFNIQCCRLYLPAQEACASGEQAFLLSQEDSCQDLPSRILLPVTDKADFRVFSQNEWLFYHLGDSLLACR